MPGSLIVSIVMPAPDAPRDPGPSPSDGAAGASYVGISSGEAGEGRGAPTFAELIVDAVRDALLVLDLDLRVVAANTSFYETFGVGPEQTVGRLVYDLGNGQWDVPRLRELLEDVLPTDLSFNDFEVEHEFEHVGRRVMVLDARQLRDHERILLAIEDATERRRTEEALRESEERFRLFAENAREYAVIGMDEAARITTWSPSAERMLGWTQEEALGQPGAIIFTEEDRAAGAPEQERETARAEGSALDERWHVRKDGSRFWGTGVMVALRDGGLRGYAKVLRDNTQQKTAEAALRASEARLQSAFAIDTVGVVFWGPAVTIAEVNGAFLKMTRFEYDEVVGMSWQELTPEEYHPVSWRAVAELEETGQSRPYEKECYRKDGSRWWGLFAARRLSEGEAVEFILDITDQKRAEHDLRRLNETLEHRVEERTQQVRELAQALTLAEQEERRRIAHVLHEDLQQTLAGAQIKAALGETDRAEELLGEAITVTRRLAHELSPPLLGHRLSGLLEWLVARKQELYGLAVALDVRDDVSIRREDLRVLLYQLLRELLFNVVKHAGTAEARLVAEQGEDPSGVPCVRVAVEDDGAGFDPALLDEPSRAGLGLPSVRERLELVGGRLAVDTAPGAGTRVTIEVPAGRPEG